MTEFSRNRPLKILFLTSHAPQGEDHGARLRVRHLLLQLSKFGEVRLILAGAYEKFTGVTNSVSNASMPSEVFEFGSWKIGSWIDRIRNEFGSGYLNTNRAKATPEDRKRLLELMDEHDLVWVHGLRIANGFDLWKWPKTILDIDDIPSERTRSEMIQAKSPLAKLRAYRQYRMWKRHESRIFERFAAMAVCSEPDHAQFGNSENVFVVPNGFDAPSEMLDRKPVKPRRIGFIGSLEYPANANGLRWFLTNVWSRILEKEGDVVLRVAGRASGNPEWLGFPNVEGLGWLADADVEMATWAFTIVPIFEGGGTRVKISNAFSRKCPVISTRLGAYGYDVSSERELLIADSISDFTASCLRLLEDNDLAVRLANSAWEAFLKKWTWDSNAPRLKRAICFVLGQNSRSFNLVSEQVTLGSDGTIPQL